MEIEYDLNDDDDEGELWCVNGYKEFIIIDWWLVWYGCRILENVRNRQEDV